MADHRIRRMAKIYGVTPEALPAALEREENARAARHAEYERVKAINDAHDEGRHCGSDCRICQNAGRTL
jgi:hypothetical protein